MRYVSTKNPTGPTFSLAEGLRLGPAPDGGLLVPVRRPELGDTFWRDHPGRSLSDTALAVMSALVGDALPTEVLRRLLDDALDFPLPLHRVTERVALLELFHGPTLAFKDVGARTLARLLPATAGGEEVADSLVVVATSGDTGGAVAQAFHGVEGTRVAILYPDGQVSPVQERQFTTLGGNVHAFAVDGTFDDCQRLVKAAFADRELRRSLGLTSANSINLGRLLPQAVYYAHAVAQLLTSAPDRSPIFVVPSGNFGNLTAGLLARRLGLDRFGASFVAATNANDVVPRYLAEGVYSPRDSVRTLSNAMDVGDPSNLARIRHLYGDDVAALRRDVRGVVVDDEMTQQTIRRVDRDHGVLLDPHTAVGWHAAETVVQTQGDDAVAIVLATAHPAKFAEVVEPVVGRQIEMPERLARHLHQEVKSVRLSPEIDHLRDALRTLPS
ncbi:MAG: threonine synthase [Thermoanaerobaculia bacterium]|nr:threonine synthase [Thermoanaerobaculia bacterium]